jgi:Prenyltransferase and squalene oxidase repeat
MHAYDEKGNLIETKERKAGWWSKIGGGSLSIAALVHFVALVFGAFWIFQISNPVEKKTDFMPSGGGGGERGIQHQVQQKKRAQITPTASVKRVFAEGAVATYAIPEQSDNFGEKSSLSSLTGGGMSGGLGGSGGGSGFGKGPGMGSGMGLGSGTGKLFGLVPETMRKRCSKEDRLERLAKNGGTPACEEAVLKSLRWLKSVQSTDGSWGETNKAAMTGFALLSYFGHCETPVSEEFGESCVKGIGYLVNLALKNDGKMASDFTANSFCYEHAIATYALGEAATFCKDLRFDIPSLPQMTEKSGQFIIDNQKKNGGWAYVYNVAAGTSDVSITGWQLQALKACSHTDLRYRGMTSCINKGLQFLVTCQAPSGGFGYNSQNPVTPGYCTLTGVGMLCHQMWGKGGRSEVRNGAKYIVENTKLDYNSRTDCDLYCHYYESQAMMQMGGDDWKFYNNLFRDQILGNQADDGSWKEPGKVGSNGELGGNGQGKVYRTCLCTLMLEVYYRFLNTGGGNNKTTF